MHESETDKTFVDGRLTGRIISSKLGRWRIGSVSMHLDEAQQRFINRPSGHVSPAMVRETLAEAARFGERHPHGWSYIVETSGVLIPNPLNIAYLSKIPELPHIAAYVIVAPSRLVRMLANGLKQVSHPDAVVASLEELA